MECATSEEAAKLSDWGGRYGRCRAWLPLLMEILRQEKLLINTVAERFTVAAGAKISNKQNVLLKKCHELMKFSHFCMTIQPLFMNSLILTNHCTFCRPFMQANSGVSTLRADTFLILLYTNTTQGFVGFHKFEARRNAR